MINFDKVKSEFIKHGGVLKTSELNSLGLYSRHINRLVEEDTIVRIKHGFYELTDWMPKDEVIIARLFPDAVIFLESALVNYGYTDRMPSAWQIAVDKNSKKSQYAIDFPPIEPYYIEPKFLEVGVLTKNIENIQSRIYDRDRTICDILRYENKLEREVFSHAVHRYVKDPKKNARKLFEYAEIFNIKNKVQTYIGVWM